MNPAATRLVRPANVVLAVAVAVGLALLRLLMGRPRRTPSQARNALLQSVAGEEDPGSALEDLHPRPGGHAPTLH